MLTARNAQLAIRKMYVDNGNNITPGNAIPFNNGYDNVTGGTASIATFNAMMSPTPGKLEFIYYGAIHWGIYNDALGATNHQILVNFYKDIATVNYSITLNVTQTLGANPLVPFENQQGNEIGLVSTVYFASRCTIHFSGYLFPIS